MIINNEDKAKEVLSDVGYYRLGFYWFPFERSYPCKVRRTHEFREGTNFDDIVRLYYFDFNLRGILTNYLNYCCPVKYVLLLMLLVFILQQAK